MVDNLSSGVWGVVATPFLGPSLEVDETSVSRLVKHYERIGVTGLTVLGVFGEAARLSGEERRTVLEAVAASVELPLVVGVTGLATAPVIEEARQVREVVGDRLAGLMVQVNSPDPRVVAAHLNAVHDATGAGIVVQDYPEASKVAIRTADLVRAVQAVPSAVGVKAEAPPTPAAVAVLTAQLDVPVFGGLGGLGLLDELAAGAAGAMTGFSCPRAWSPASTPGAAAVTTPPARHTCRICRWSTSRPRRESDWPCARRRSGVAGWSWSPA